MNDVVVLVLVEDVEVERLVLVEDVEREVLVLRDVDEVEVLLDVELLVEDVEVVVPPDAGLITSVIEVLLADDHDDQAPGSSFPEDVSSLVAPAIVISLESLALVFIWLE